MNIVTLIGNLATDVELKELGEEKHLATFLLAVDRPGGETADFVRIAVWDKQAAVCQRYLAKGKRVAIDGRLRSHSWEEEGKRRTLVEVHANRVQFLSPPEHAGAAAAAAADDIPFEAALAS